jgi:hypothetical protein
MKGNVRHQLKDAGQCMADFEPGQFFVDQASVIIDDSTPHHGTIKLPPRLLSDRLLVCYFQEHHPLFPVLHWPTFLAAYEKLVGNDITDLASHDIAKLFLVFAISLQRNDVRQSAFGEFW